MTTLARPPPEGAPSGAFALNQPATPRRHPQGNQEYTPTRRHAHNPYISPNKHTPRRAAAHPQPPASTLNELQNHLRVTRAKYYNKKARQQIPNNAIVIDIGDWNTLTTLVDNLSLGNTTQRDARLAETVAALSANITNLRADLDARLTSLEDTYKFEKDRPHTPLTYSQALQSSHPDHPAPPNSAPEPYNTRPNRNPEQELTLVQADASQPVYATTDFPALKSKVEGILGELGIENASGRPMAIRTISRHPSKDIIIALHSAEDAHILRTRAAHWVPKLSTQLSLKRTLYPVICHRIPTDFDPSTPEAIEELKSAAAGRLDSLVRVAWANPKKAHPDHGPPKKSSSIIIYPADPIQANNIIQYGLPFRATLHPAEKSRRSLIQCHKCQHFGHTAARCSAPPACGRCAAPHVTTECLCPEATPCTDHRTCTHVPFSCTLCGQAHRANYRECPSRINALHKLHERGLHEGELYKLYIAKHT
jgi:hypothetical protein